MTKEPKASKATKSPTVAQYLEMQFNLCGKSQIEIATECGFPKPNILSMIKQGKTKLPISKIAVMAKSLGVDPLHLFKLCMQEYEPANWEAIQETILKQPVITANEMEIIRVIRKSNVINPKLRTNEERIRLLDVIATLKPENATND